MVATDRPSEVIRRRYVLHRKLGVGGMGAVYVALDRLTGETVALKRVGERESGMDTEALRLALTREFRVLASLRHPNVIGVLDYGFDDERQPFFTMTLVEDARTLRQAGRTQALTGKVDLIIQLLQALVYLHRRGIIHRDLKPDNALVTREGQVKVLDFGLATVARDRVRAAQHAGTIRYMAPEVLQSRPPTEASDLFSVGVMAYELLTGRYAFDGANAQELIANVVALEPDLTGIDILTSGDLRRAARQNATQDEDGQAESQDSSTATAPTLDQTILLNDTRPQDDVPTQVIEQDARSSMLPTSGRDYEMASPFVRVIARLMAKRPENRYQDAREVIRDLRAALGQTLPSESAAIRDSFLQAARFVGRERPLRRLTAALHAMRSDQGSLWLVGGESGVGKSRLLEEMRTVAMVQGVTVLRGHATDDNLPYMLWREPLRHMLLGVDVSAEDAAVLKPLVPDIDRLLERPVGDAPELDAADAHERLMATVCRLFVDYCAANRDGVLLILEDLHWATSSLHVLQALKPQLGALPLLIVCSYRNDDAPDLPERVGDCETLMLDRLNPDNIAELSESMLGLAGRTPQVLDLLQRETEGNPYFLIEVARALADAAGDLERVGTMPLPERVFAGGIDAILQHRIDQVAAAYRPLLALAAIHGRDVDMAVMTQVAGATPVENWLTACVNAAIMEWQDGHWRFAHDKLRDRLLETLPPDARAESYRRVAEAVEAVYETALEQQAAQLAAFWAQAGNSACEYHYSVMAAQTAVEMNDYADGDAFYSRALALLLSGDVPHAVRQEVDLRVKLGDVAQRLGQYDRALDILSTALRLAQSIDSPRQVAEARIALGWVRLRQGETMAAHEQAAAAMALVDAVDDPWLRVEALHLHGMTDLTEGRYDDAKALLVASLPLVRALADRTHEANVLNALGAAEEALGNDEAATQVLSAALMLANALGNRALAATVKSNLGRLAYHQGRYTRAEVYLNDALPVFRSIGNVYGEAKALYFLGFIAATNAPYHALSLLRESVALSLRIGAVTTTLIALCGVARLAAQLGREDHAAELIGLVLYHAASTADADVEREAVPLLNQIGATLPAEALDAALTRGKQRRLESIASDFDALVQAFGA